MSELKNSVSIFLEKNSISKPMLVTTRSSFDNHFKEFFSEISYVRFLEFSNNPKDEDLKRGHKVFLDSGCDGLISVGGGSAMDMAKMISLISLNPKLNLKEKLNPDSKYNVLPHLAIPTTAGSGSEVTQFAVLYIDGQKYSIDHIDLLPKDYFLEPQFIRHLPKKQLACSGLDAFCQAVESHWSRRSCEESRVFSSQAIPLIWSSLQSIFIDNDKSNKSLSKLQKGSHLAGRSINITRTTAPHAVSYPFTSMFELPHGNAVSLSLLFFMKLNLESLKSNYWDSKDETLRRIEEIFTLIDCKGFEEFKEIFTLMSQKMSIELSGFNLTENQKDRILSKINIQRLSNNPVKVTEKDLIAFLNYV